jgi:beta-1,4-mannosyltransferase
VESYQAPRVYAWPRRLPSNKYPELLYGALSKQGVDVRPLRWRVKSILRAAVERHPNKWLHFHWVGYSGRSLTVTCAYWILIFLGMTALKFGGLRLAWTVHNLTPHNCRWRKINRLGYSLLLSRMVDVVFTHAEWTRERLEQEYKWSGNTVVVPHGNYCGVYPNTISKAAIRDRHLCPRDSFVFLFVGSLSKYKGLDVLIENFKKLNGADLRLWIVGAGNETVCHQLKSLAAGDPRIMIDTRFVPDDELGSLLSAADVIVLPYKEITTSGSLVLALSFGKPVIAPAVGSIPEYANSNCAFLYDPDTRDGLILAMKQSLNADLQAMGYHAMNLASKWDWDIVASRFADAFVHNS